MTLLTVRNIKEGVEKERFFAENLGKYIVVGDNVQITDIISNNVFPQVFNSLDYHIWTQHLQNCKEKLNPKVSSGRQKIALFRHPSLFLAYN